MSCDCLNTTIDCSSQCFCHLSRNKLFLIQCDNEHLPLNCSQSQFLPSTYSSCLHFCEQTPSQQVAVLSIICRTCSNVTCRCIHSIPSCSSPVTPRWMQKRGFPAAAILALLVLAAGLLVVALKLIYRQLDRRANQQSLLVSQTA